MNLSHDPPQLSGSISLSNARIRCAPGVQLSPEQLQLLAQALGGSHTIFVKREFRSGYSGALVLLVSLGNDRAPVVLKLAHPLDLQREYDAYQQFVRQISPQNIAHLQGEPLVAADGQLGLLQYSFAGGESDQAATSLKDYYATNGGNSCSAVLNRIFRVYGRYWWGNNHPDLYTLGEQYDRLLPVHLQVAYTPRNGQPTQVLKSGSTSILALHQVNIGQHICLRNFHVTKVQAGGRKITLMAPPPAHEASAPLRVRLELDEQRDPLLSYQPGDTIDQVDAIVVATRQTLLCDAAIAALPTYEPDQAIFTVDLDGSYTLPAGVTLLNPLYDLASLLNRVIETKTSTIHGDLNLQNILVDATTGFAWIIDFGETRRGPTLLDLQRLEVQVITKLLSDAMRAARLAPALVVSLIAALHADPLPSVPPVPELLAPFQLLVTVRRLARQYLIDDLNWDEYYLGLVIGLVGALKYDELDTFDRSMALVAAATARGLIGHHLSLEDHASDPRQAAPSPVVASTDVDAQRLEEIAAPERVEQEPAPNPSTDSPALKSLNQRIHNLPAQPTPLLGREAEIEQLHNLLLQPHVRLVTLVGPGGTGKTRLSIQIAMELVDQFSDGLFLVPLEPIADPSRVIYSIVQALHIDEARGQPLLETLKIWLRERNLLLLLDNFEQVLDAAPLIAELLGAAPKLKILVTSREVLRLRGEHEFLVPPLALPPLQPIHPAPGFAAELPHYAAAMLFIERAKAVQPNFTVTDESAPVIAEICRRLDGLPLAIELAAARVKLLPPKALLTRLVGDGKNATGSRVLQALAVGPRDLPARQQTLRATIAWSYELLTAEEQMLFRRLAIFPGGLTIEAAEAVCGSPGDLQGDTLEGLASLLDKSLLRQEPGTDGEPRFVLLRTIAEFASEKLEEAGEMVALCSAHAQYYLALATEADAGFVSGEQALWLQRLDTEYANLRAALDTLLQDQGSDLSLHLASALRRYWMLRGPVSEARQVIARVLSHPGTADHSKRRAGLLQVAASLARRQSDYAAAEAMSLESLAIVRELGDTAAVATVLVNMGNLYAELDDYARARTLQEEALALQRTLNNQHEVAVALDNLGITVGVLGEQELSRTLHAEALEIARELNNPLLIAYAATNLGTRYILLGEPMTARPLLEEALALQRQLGDSFGAAVSLGALGSLAMDANDFVQARSFFAEGLALYRADGNMWGIYHRLLSFAQLAATQDRPERAAHLWGAVEALGEQFGMSMDAENRAIDDQYVARTHTQIDDSTFAAAWAAGRKLSLEQAITYALEEEV